MEISCISIRYMIYFILCHTELAYYRCSAIIHKNGKNIEVEGVKRNAKINGRNYKRSTS